MFFSMHLLDAMAFKDVELHKFAVKSIALRLEHSIISMMVDMNSSSEIFKALAEPNRLAILEELRKGEQCVCRLQEVIDLPQNLLSHHLSVLRSAGLVRCRKEGKWVYYSLCTKKFMELKQFAEHALQTKNTTSRC